MIKNWAQTVAGRMLGEGPHPEGSFLFLGAADTGKTSLFLAFAARLARGRPVALVDADVGQSHIGPPTTVGWTILEAGRPETDETLEAQGIAFVGDVTPVGHLLQLTVALATCIEQTRGPAKIVLIDTPGFVAGGAACTLWWTIQRLFRPQCIIALQREGELVGLLRGLEPGLSRVEVVQAPAGLRWKSPEARRQHRNRLWARYFENATEYSLDLMGIALRPMHRIAPDDAVGRVVGLADDAGRDIAVGAVEQWRPDGTKATILAPGLDAERVRCLTVGDVRIEM